MRAESRLPWLLSAALVIAAGAVLLIMGRSLICPCGTIRLWHGVVASSENSQQLSDWYTPSHLIHGFLFYWGLHLVLPRVPIGWRFLIAMAVEVGWEILENTDAVIDRYRAVTISYEYFGDSVLNSVADMGAMALGFWMAARLPVWLIVTLALALEIGTTLIIRDGLTLNVLMLVWPLDVVRDWQAAG